MNEAYSTPVNQRMSQWDYRDVNKRTSTNGAMTDLQTFDAIWVR